MPISPITDIIADIRLGKMVIIVDDEDRENEGDLLMAAACVRPADINFMARYGRGLICLTLTRQRCEQLRLPLMVTDTNDKHLTNFTVSIEAAEGVTTGISAADRARTVQAAVAPHATAADIVMPGHIFPIMAQPGGVLTRAGHTEAGCDLARLAGFEAAAVIVEILDDDGTMARRPALEIYAQEHGLKLGTIADLIHYRLQHEHSVERMAECDLPSAHGTLRLIAYQDTLQHGQQHLALVLGRITPETPTLVRVHISDRLSDTLTQALSAGLTLSAEDCGMPFAVALAQIAAVGSGVMVILNGPDDPAAVVARISDRILKTKGILPAPPPRGPDLRTYGLGAQILADLGVRKMRVLGSPRRMHALSGFGLEVVEYVAAKHVP